MTATPAPTAPARQSVRTINRTRSVPPPALKVAAGGMSGRFASLTQWVDILPFVCKADGKPPAAAAVTDRGRIRPAARRKRALVGTGARQQRDQPGISLMAPRFVINLVRFVALQLVFLLNRPRLGPCRLVIEGDGILPRASLDAPAPFH